MSPLIDGLAVRGRLQVLGAAADPIEVQTGSLIMGGRSIQGSLTGTPRDAEDNLAYALAKDRKSTRLNSSHANISYAVFCLKKKKHARMSNLLHSVHHRAR